ncbi:triose phosphate isomerase [Coniophora puteana RWD-64-598 SS2]|uniref:Triosephosphate isomerase n=1 Tax=Coniophora puteana (strain RWD-64-598) TaxID=741705 RepID=A0A5M3M8V9_CONPW|nr:triose phosphate isomerase [Coniophora puteana RWD-64-598 SS2]EIW75523.1 triose phosphate isomerase [Coniophora puteana RWD-64-598 SS2]
MARKFFVGGNFKMNPGSLEAKKAIVNVLNKADVDPNTEVVISPPALYLIPLVDFLRKDFSVSAQNCHEKLSGAFTGEISPTQLADAGVPWVILGHSERRTLFGENEKGEVRSIVAAKTKAALDAGLKVILCVGEKEEQREAGKTDEVVRSQLEPVFEVLKGDDAAWSKIVIAYEPVWAIGTGKVASPKDAQETHAATRKFLAERVSPAVAESTRIIYGGSVSAKNCKELSTQPDIDGFLVGGASLKPEFVDIINSKRA